jgi:hypothetical protein
MKKLVEWRVFLPTIAVLAAIAFGASHALGLSFLPVLALTVAAVLVNGLLATLEDDLPGGFNNPDGTATPVYASRTASFGKWVVSIALIVFAIAFVQSGLSGGTPSELPFVAGIAIACLLFAVALFVRRTWLLLAALASGFAGIIVSAFIR